MVEAYTRDPSQNVLAALGRNLAILLLAGLSIPAWATLASAEVTRGELGTFTVTHEATVPVDPETAYDHLTGDISGWWDHTMSGAPARFFIEPRPGGGFYEYFDAEGRNGVLHATVIYAHRGERLTFRGPLGFNGRALDLVVTYRLEAVEGGTRVTVECRGAGEMEEGWPETVDGVWHHFLVQRYVPYVEQQVGD